jgi:hypothetical protein
MSETPFGPNRIYLVSRTRQALKADLPSELVGRYYIDGRSRPGLGFYLDRQSQRPVIRDMGRALDTWRTDEATIADMLKVAQHRGWRSLHVQGDWRFRREVWRQGAALGLDVRGYRPKTNELAAARTRLAATPPPVRSPNVRLHELADGAKPTRTGLSASTVLLAAEMADPQRKRLLLQALGDRLRALGLERGPVLRKLLERGSIGRRPDRER